MKALEGAVELVQGGLVAELGERIDHLLFDFFLVEGADERRLAVRARVIVFGLPPIV
jgi:hypothetical protein